MVELNAETKGVMKLTLAGGGTHRIALSKLWDTTTDTLSYERLVELATKFGSSVKNTDHVSRCTVTVTYRDEDGDVITISSDEELCDAFEQFVGETPPVLRADATVVEIDSVVEEQELLSGFKNDRVNDMNSFKDAKVWHTKKQEMREKRVKELKELRKRGGVEGKLHAKAKEMREIRMKKLGNYDSEKQAILDSMEEMEKELKKEKRVKKFSKKGQKEMEVASVNDEKKIVIPKGFLPDFIHGRHTCDGCLVTPIVGIRYHAKNRPDYDLCQTCLDKYKGDEITFEPMQQENDLQMQNRWKRKQQRLNMMQCSGLHPFPGMRKGLQARRVVQNMDSALKEAIRRSLEDAESTKCSVGTKSDSKLESKSEKSVQSTDEVTQSTDNLSTQKSLNVPPKEEKDGTCDEASEEDISIPCKEVHVMSDIAPEDELENVADSKSNVTVETSSCPSLIDEVPSTVDNENTPEENVTLDEEKEVEKEICGCSPEKNEPSFTEDAAGEGDVALAIANTLDHTANVINAIVTEVSSESKCSDCTCEKDPSITLEKDCSQEKDCQTILDSVEDTGADVSQGNDNLSDNESDWQVLDEEGKEVAHDEMIAQAAQMLGSALFQSDIFSDDKTENQTTNSASMSSSSSSKNSKPEFFSSVTTVPSSIGSVNPISSVLLCRWEDELKQLHELGFLDDHKSIEAIEHLEAANIGVDSTEPININKVVDYLLSNKIKD